MKGEDGVDEMKEDLNANKIMYAFIRVQDPKTSLPKFVLLNWQGESAPGTRDTTQCDLLSWSKIVTYNLPFSLDHCRKGR